MKSNSLKTIFIPGFIIFVLGLCFLLGGDMGYPIICLFLIFPLIFFIQSIISASNKTNFILSSIVAENMPLQDCILFSTSMIIAIKDIDAIKYYGINYAIISIIGFTITKTIIIFKDKQKNKVN